MSEQTNWWGSLNHYGLLIGPDKIASSFTDHIADLSN